MKRNILLAMVLVMLASISGCLIGWEEDGRGGRGGGYRDGGHERDGGHDRDQRRDERR